MATFKVGQRVRIIGAPVHAEVFIGHEGVIVCAGVRYEWHVALDRDVPGVKRPADFGLAGVPLNSCHLAPLTDPGALAFIERIKKLGREPVTLTDKQLAEVKIA